MENYEAMVKTALASADLTAGGYLNPMQSENFLRGVIDQPTILKECRTVFIDGESKLIEKVGFGSRIMRPGVENVALTDAERSKPQFGKVQLTTKEAIAEVRISYDTLENNIEGAKLKNTLMAMIQERVALDLEELGLQGDTTLVGSDPYLGLMDGFLKKASTHVVNALANPVALNYWKSLISATPAKYRRVPAQWRIYTSGGVDLDWKEAVAARNTVAGDRFLLQNVNAAALGYEIQPCAMIPVVADLSTALLTHPKNLIAGFTRKVQIETDKDITARQIIIVVTVKVDFAIEEVDACSKLINIGVNTGVTTPEVDLGDIGEYYYEMTTKYAAEEVLTISGVAYTCKAAEDIAAKQFAVGADIAAQIVSLVEMVVYPGFNVTGDNDRLVFTQKVACTDLSPTLVAESEAATGAIAAMTTVLAGRTSGDPVV